MKKQALNEVNSNDWLGFRMYYEHGHLCIRTQTGMLMWNVPLINIDNFTGIEINEIIKTISKPND